MCDVWSNSTNSNVVRYCLPVCKLANHGRQSLAFCRRYSDVTHSIHDSTISLVHDSPLFMKMVWKYILLVLEYCQSLFKNIISNASFCKLTKFHLGTICSQRIKYRGITGRNTLGRNKYFDPQEFFCTIHC